ncbi:MAG: VTT domain-containing protein [Variibacter sp.]
MPHSIFQPGRNVWGIAQASRAAVLIDGAAFFAAVREALLKAQRSIFIVGWDIDSRTRLVGEDCAPDDGKPIPFANFLSALVRERPDLTVHLLLWDYSVLYALEREIFPTLSLHWSTPRQVQVCLDDAIPLGSSHHQKIIIVDDAIAFSGGLDLTIRRWDTSDHRLDNPDRVDPSGKPYRPFHDVQAMVDGDAARALAALVRARWTRACGDMPAPLEPAGKASDDPWPGSVVPDFTDVAVGIARTLPRHEEQTEVREVETLFRESIATAERSLYVENQFVTSARMAQALAQALRKQSRLEVVIVAPQHYHSWIEAHTMRNGRIRFKNLIEDAGVADRVRLVYPHIEEGGRVTDTMVHSKIMIVDDWLLRVGSANLNNRSMAVDTECDLVFAARDETQRAAIRNIRNKLLGEHCGLSAEDIARAIASGRSLIEIADTASARGHSLRPIEDGTPDPDEISATIEEVADPLRPFPLEIDAQAALGARFSQIQVSTMIKIALAAILVIALPLTWKYTPLSLLADPRMVSESLASVATGAWGPPVILACFVIGGLIAFPVTVLIAVTAATFGPFLGFAYAAIGCLASALVTFLIGAALGKDLVRGLLGPRLDRIRRRIVNQGIIAVALIRVVPVAPFTLVNLVAGASQIRLQDFMAGTALGMAPGLVIMSALGHQIFQIATKPTLANVVLLVVAVLSWLAVSFGVQIMVAKMRKADR